MSKFGSIFAIACLLLAISAPVWAQEKELSDSEYIARALSAAPAAVAKDAAVVRMDKDKDKDKDKSGMRTLREGKNGFTCMVGAPGPMCNDANAMAFIEALLKHQTPPDKVGICYMLAGDTGTSNTDPYATHKTADNHWIATGPHVMLLGAASKNLGYTTAKDPDPGKPYMMWVGTPYEHAMIPVQK